MTTALTILAWVAVVVAIAFGIAILCGISACIFALYAVWRGW